MKHLRCYACNKFGHKVKECIRKFRTSNQKEHTSSHSNVLKKTKLLSERCGIAQFADITNPGEAEDEKLQYSNFHT